MIQHYLFYDSCFLALDIIGLYPVIVSPPRQFGGINFYPYICIVLIMPTVLYLFGLRFYFYSDEHLPMHVHVENGDGKAKISIETAEVLKNSGIKPQDLKKAVDAVSQYKEDLIQAWKEHFDEE